MPLSNSRSPDCLTLRELSLYYSGGLDDDAVMLLEDHLAGCPFCLALSDRVADSAQEILEEGIVRARALAFLQHLPAAPTVANLQARLGRWVELGANLVARVRVLGNSPVITLDGLEALLAPSTPFQLSSATTSSTRGHGPERHEQILQIRGAGALQARFSLDAKRRRVSVQIDNWPVDLGAPLVAISSGQSGGRPPAEMRKLPSLEENPALVDLVAEFDYPADDLEFLVVVEPITP